ncbi:helix-hairpin-helix domain-containing protein [Syntrophomonas erecta]
MGIDRRVLAGLVLAVLIAFVMGTKYGGYKEQHNQEELIVNPVSTDMEVNDREEDKIIQVYVVGAVNKPGVYRMNSGARVYEAIEKAEPQEEADLTGLDLARVLQDEESIPVPLAGEIPAWQQNNVLSYQSTSSTNNGKVNINTASAGEMAERLQGIGPALAQRIIDYRTQNGPFNSIDELKNVSGIGEKRFASIKDDIRVK